MVPTIAHDVPQRVIGIPDVETSHKEHNLVSRDPLCYMPTS